MPPDMDDISAECRSAVPACPCLYSHFGQCLSAGGLFSSMSFCRIPAIRDILPMRHRAIACVSVHLGKVMIFQGACSIHHAGKAMLQFIHIGMAVKWVSDDFK